MDLKLVNSINLALNYPTMLLVDSSTHGHTLGQLASLAHKSVICKKNLGGGGAWTCHMREERLLRPFA